MNIRKISILFIITIACTNNSAAQKFTLSSELRPRVELRDGYKMLFSESDHFAAHISQRTRLNFGYEKDMLSMNISVQDVRLWGDVAAKKDVAGTFINEAWANLKLSESSSIKFGRQALKYENQRLIAVANWNQISARHDAVKLQYGKSDWNMDFVAAFNQSKALSSGTFYDMANFYKTLNILWISKTIGNLRLATLHIADGYQSKTANETLYVRYTPGISTYYNKGKFAFNGHVYFQTGLIEKDKEISAFSFNLEASLKLNAKYSITAGLDYLSGDDPNDTKYNAFDILYGKKHGTYGYMDYFSTTKSTKDGGLIDPYLKLKSKLSEKSELQLHYHYLSLEQSTINTYQKVDKYLGSEIDITYKYKHSNDIGLQLGYSLMFAGETTEIIKGSNKSNIGNFAYVMISIQPTLFTSND